MIKKNNKKIEKKTYYVVIPSSRIKGTLYETYVLGYTANKFAFIQFLTISMPLIADYNLEKDIEILIYESYEKDKLFRDVYHDTGYQINVNHEIEIFESINDPQFALYFTWNFADTLFEIGDYYIEDFTRLLWKNLHRFKLCESFICCPNEIIDLINLLITTYSNLMSLLLEYIFVNDINNSDLKEIVSNKLIKDETNLEYFSINSLIDMTLLWYLSLSHCND